jgi:predicted N-acetyltransferase YhbS
MLPDPHTTSHTPSPPDVTTACVVEWSAATAISKLAVIRMQRAFALSEELAARTVSRIVGELRRARCATMTTSSGQLALLRTPWRIPGLASPEWYIPLAGWQDERVLAELPAVLTEVSAGRRARFAAAPLEVEALRAAAPHVTTIFVRKREEMHAVAHVSGVEIRRSRRADAAWIRGSLELALRRGFQQAEGKDPEPEMARVLVGRLVRSALGVDGISFVAIAQGEVVGHASGQLFDEDDFGEGKFAALTDISTAPDHGGRGIGSQLEEVFVREAFGRGARFVEGTVIPTDPERTLALLNYVIERGWRVHRSLIQVA